ncbi:hypothetical protein V7122_05365 [Bacillus sp. JJ1532]
MKSPSSNVGRTFQEGKPVKSPNSSAGRPFQEGKALEKSKQ